MNEKQINERIEQMRRKWMPPKEPEGYDKWKNEVVSKTGARTVMPTDQNMPGWLVVVADGCNRGRPPEETEKRLKAYDEALDKARTMRGRKDEEDE